VPREISDEQYAAYEQAYRTANFAESIFNDPALSKDAKRLIKRKYPNLSIPDFDLEEKFEKERAADKKSRDDETRAAKQKQEEDGWKEQRAKTQKEYGFTDEGMKDLEKFMLENNVANYDVAATYKAAKSPRASEPTSQHGMPWAHTADETFREIAKDPEAWGRGEILKAIRADQDRARQAR
jgi:hypothetical protein